MKRRRKAPLFLPDPTYRCADYRKGPDRGTIPSSIDFPFDFRHAKESCKRSHLLYRDNRKHLRAIWGKPHFHFRGEFDFHGWSFLNRACNLRYIVLTAATKGTCYEVVHYAGLPERISREWTAAIVDHHAAWFSFVLKELRKRPRKRAISA